jgi:hypothetical protein
MLQVFFTLCHNKDSPMITLTLTPHDRDSDAISWSGASLTHCVVEMLRHFDAYLQECADEEMLGDLLDAAQQVHNSSGNCRLARQSTMCGNGFDLVMLEQ